MENENVELKRRVAQALVGQGFFQVGVVSAEADLGLSNLERWLASGFSGTMRYMSKDSRKRAIPAEKFPGARSLVVAALNYFHLDETSPTVSKYAQIPDYHEVIRAKLAPGIRLLRDAGARMCVSLVDTAQIMEKPAAVLAGIGWIGKHTNVINKELGSFFFLGEIVTDLPLPNDEPFGEDHCGECTRCIDLCPTHAIVKPYVLDATKCISYLTIEYRGVIPRELRPLIGTLIFGCDICQDVCPWNKYAQESVEIKGSVPDRLKSLSFERLLTLSEEEFRYLTRDTPLRRPGFEAFMRNVIVAAGNSGNTNLVPLLIVMLDSDREIWRQHAVTALSALHGTSAIQHLQARLAKERSHAIASEIQQSISELSS